MRGEPRDGSVPAYGRVGLHFHAILRSERPWDLPGSRGSVAARIDRLAGGKMSDAPPFLMDLELPGPGKA